MDDFLPALSFITYGSLSRRIKVSYYSPALSNIRGLLKVWPNALTSRGDRLQAYPHGKGIGLLTPHTLESSDQVRPGLVRARKAKMRFLLCSHKSAWSKFGRPKVARRVYAMDGVRQNQ